VAADGKGRKRSPRSSSRRHELVVAGLGGQGVLLATQLLVRAGLREYPHVCWFPTYATLVRGGDCEGTAILSDEPIHSPLVYRPQALIIMSTGSLRSFSDRMGPGSLLILDTSLVPQWEGRDGVETVKVPATQRATELGSPQSANLLLLGVYLKKTGAVRIETAEAALRERLAQEGKEAVLAKNIEALRFGYSSGG